MTTRINTLHGVAADAGDNPYLGVPVLAYLSTPGGTPVKDQEGRLLYNGTRYGVGQTTSLVDGTFDIPAVYVGDLTQPDGSATTCRLVVSFVGQLIESPTAGYSYASTINVSTWLPSSSTTGTTLMILGSDDVSNTPFQDLALAIDITVTAVKPDGRVMYAGQPIQVYTDASGNIAVPLVPTSLLSPSTARYKIVLPGATWYFNVPVNPTGYLGAYNGATAYVAGNVVLSGGILYQAIASTTGHTPPNATYWIVWAGEPIILHRDTVAITGATVVNTTNLAPSASISLETLDPNQVITNFDQQLGNLDHRSIHGDLHVRTVAANFTATNTDDVILVNAASGAIAGTIPTAIGQSKTLRIYSMPTSAHSVTLTPVAGGQTLNGTTSYVLTTADTGADFESDQANYSVVPLGGSGSVPVSNPRTFNVRAYGAVGNGSTNDTTAINLAIAALNSAGGGILYVPTGTYLINAALTAISVYCTVQGDGSGLSVINCSSGTAAALTITALSGLIQDIGLVNTAGSTPTAGCGILINAAAFCRVDFYRVSITGFYIGLDTRTNTNWVMQGCAIIGPVQYGVKIVNTVNPDAGDWVISDSFFYAATYTAAAAIRMESSGGGKISGCKINTGTTRFNFGIDIAGAGTTGILLVTGTSIENINTNCIRQIGNWDFLSVTGCELALYTSNNTSAIYLNGAVFFTLVALTLIAPTSTAAAINLTGCDSGSLAAIERNGFSALLVQTSCTNINDLTAGGYTLPTASTTVLGGVKVDGSSITIASGVISATGGGGGGGLVLISEQTVSGSVAASINFASIANSHKTLILEIVGRGDYASGDPNVLVQFNGDTGANYDYELLYGANATPVSSDSTGQTSIIVGTLPGSGTTAGLAGNIHAELPVYANTNFWKGMLVDSGYNSGPTYIRYSFFGQWHNTAAITSILLTLDHGNFDLNSVCRLWGAV